jgi:hypothetical protein
VLDGLRWLARHQNDDGSWGAVSFRSHCPDSAPCYDVQLSSKDNFDVGLTSLALLCFLGRRVQPREQAGSRRHGEG